MCFIEKKILKQDRSNDNISMSWKLILLICGGKGYLGSVSYVDKKTTEEGEVILDSMMMEKNFGIGGSRSVPILENVMTSTQPVI